MKSYKNFMLLSLILCLSTKVYSVKFIDYSIENLKAKKVIKVKQLKIWNADSANNVNEFLRAPVSIAMDSNNNIYICDFQENKIKVFNQNYKFIKSIGRRGKGPGDFLAPIDICFNKSGQLHVAESMGLRIQKFDSKFKSMDIMKLKYFPYKIGINSNENVVVYSHFNTFKTKKILTIYNQKGKPIKEIGKYYEKAKSRRNAEELHFAISQNDSYIISNTKTPLLRKYNNDGTFVCAIYYRLKYQTPKVEFNQKINDIEVINVFDESKVKRSGNKLYSTADERHVVSAGLAVNDEYIFLLTYMRKISEKESKSMRVTGVAGKSIDRSNVDEEILMSSDIQNILVFDLDGNFISKIQIKGIWSKMHVFGNKLFLIDGFVTQTIKEFQLSF